jgi:aspartate oxidase
MSALYRQRPGRASARAVRGEGADVWDDTGRRLAATRTAP